MRVSEVTRSEKGSLEEEERKRGSDGDCTSE